MIIRHVTTPDEVEGALRTGQLSADSLAESGFIHCCTDAQLDGVLRRFYADRDDVVVVSIETDRLRPELRWEAPSHPDGSTATSDESAEEFPHVYGPINIEALSD